MRTRSGVVLVILLVAGLAPLVPFATADTVIGAEGAELLEAGDFSDPEEWQISNTADSPAMLPNTRWAWWPMENCLSLTTDRTISSIPPHGPQAASPTPMRLWGSRIRTTLGQRDLTSR